MDVNHLIGREQRELYLAETSRSKSARVAHRAFAKAYGALIAATGFPHRDSSSRRDISPTQTANLNGETQINDWESEGGSISSKADELLPRKIPDVDRPLS